MNKMRLNKIYDYAIGKIPLDKAQIATRLKQISKDEEHICKFLSFLINRELLYRFDSRLIEKMINHIETPKYAKWVLRFNLPYNRIKLVNLVAKDSQVSANALCDRLPLTSEEENKLFISVATNPQAIVKVIISIHKLDETKNQILLKNKDYINKALILLKQQTESNTFLDDKAKYQYIHSIDLATNYINSLR